MKNDHHMISINGGWNFLRVERGWRLKRIDTCIVRRGHK